MNAARADAIDNPAATTNAREYPALSATVTGTPPWPAASGVNSSMTERELLAPVPEADRESLRRILRSVARASQIG